MARNRSAMKYHRQSEQARLKNRSQKSMIRTFTKKAVGAAEAGETEEAQKYFRVVSSLIDKAAKRSTLHKNTAARKKSRLAKRLRTMNEAGA